MWVIYSISATTFNVLSDWTGDIISSILVFALGACYPHLVWAVVKKGKGVALDGVIAPPGGLGEAFLRFRQGGSYLFLLATTFILLVATFSHTAADAFLDFKTVEVGVSDSFFLSTQAGGLPSYALLGEPGTQVTNTPGLPGARLQQQADSIAQGTSRFSIFAAQPFVNLNDDAEALSGQLLVKQSNLTVNGFGEYVPAPPAQALPARLNVRCQSPTENALRSFIPANVSDVDSIPENANTLEVVADGFSYPNGTNFQETAYEFLFVPECDLEANVPYKTMASETEKNEGWQILDYSFYGRGSAYDGLNIEAFGVRDHDGNLRWFIEDLSLNETELPYNRDDWRLGRRIRDRLTIAILTETDDKGTENFTEYWEEPYLVHPDGVEFQVEYTVLSGPGELAVQAGTENYRFYTLSSWSKNCPGLNDEGKMLVNDVQSASGCIIDLQIGCRSTLAQDSFNISQRIQGLQPRCSLENMAVTLLSGIEVDPYMLAAYAGIATRNGGINTVPHNQPPFHGFALNSIAAAYIVTRKVVSGTMPVEGVRAQIDTSYICFFLLPLFFVLPLLWFKLVGAPAPPVPRSVWDILVLGRGEAQTVPERNKLDPAFPACDPAMKFGYTHDKDLRADRLGLGSRFVRLERQHPLDRTQLSGVVNAPTPEENNHNTDDDEEVPLDRTEPFGARYAAKLSDPVNAPKQEENHHSDDDDEEAPVDVNDPPESTVKPDPPSTGPSRGKKGTNNKVADVRLDI